MTLLERKLPFVDAMLKGVGQIMLQENSFTGLLFLIGIFYDLQSMGIAAILAVLSGTLTAKVLGFDKEETRKGLDGFSAALVGVALTFYFRPEAIIWLAIIVGSAMATILQHWFIVKKIPVFTLPFVLVTWVMILIFHYVYPIAASDLFNAKAHVSYDFTVAIKGFGEVIFQSSAFAGVVFFIGVFVNSPIAALYGIGGSVLGAAFSAQFAEPREGIEMGLFSYNAVLCAIVFASNRPRDGIWALIAVLLSVLINMAMAEYDLIQLTFPFVAATCITLAIKKQLSPYLEKLYDQFS